MTLFHKFGWVLSAVLGVTLAYGGYFFIVKGSTIETEDGRTAILLSAGERNQVLGEMRGLLEVVQSITQGLATDNMEQVVASATSAGMVMATDGNPTLIAKLPLEFKKNGFAAHTAFDTLATNARDFGDKNLVLENLSDILAGCTSCHAGYRVALEQE